MLENLVKEKAKDAVDEIACTGGAAKDGSNETPRSFGEDVAEYLGRLWGSIKSFLGHSSEKAGQEGGKVKSVADDAIEAGKDAATTISKKVKSDANTVGDQAKDAGTTVKEEAKDIGQTMSAGFNKGLEKSESWTLIKQQTIKMYQTWMIGGDNKLIRLAASLKQASDRVEKLISVSIIVSGCANTVIITVV